MIITIVLYHFKKCCLLNFLVCLLPMLIVLGTSLVYAETQISDDVVVLNTKSGKMVIELFESDAPKTTSNFVELTKQKFYDGTTFHRIIKDFMIQGGDPNTKDIKKILEWGHGGSGSTIPAEFNNIMHKRGIVSMARANDPNSASSQFFIVHKDSIFLDQKYTVFGRLVTQESYDTLDKIASMQTTGASNDYIPSEPFNAKIQSAKIQKRSTVTNLLDQGEPLRLIPKPSEMLRMYLNEDLGISFNTTSVLSIHETIPLDPTKPAITLSGSQDNKFMPQILIFVRNSTATSLEEFSDETKKLYSGLISQGLLVITNEEKSKINGDDVWIRDSSGKSTPSSTVFDFRYRETVFKNNGEFYTITYVNTVNNFEGSLRYYNQVLSSLKIDKPERSSGCLIATATYGTELAPQVQMLREIRDDVVFNTNSGTAFMTAFNEFYYSFSPTVSDLERQNQLFKELVKITLYPMLLSLSILNYVDIESDQAMIGYGLLVMTVNVGMYLGVPMILFLYRKKLKYFK